LVGVVVLVGVIVVIVPEREPEYGGKRLSEWVEGVLGASTEGRKQNYEAIGNIGTNALPYLVKWVGYDMSPWKRKFYSSPSPAVKRLRAFWHYFDKRHDSLQLGAMKALLHLGPKAEGVIPRLSRLANGAKPANSRTFAILILGEIGKPGLQDLAGVLTNQQAQVGKWTPDTSAIANYIGQNAWRDRDIARRAVPVLVEMLNAGDANMRAACKQSAGCYRPQGAGKSHGSMKAFRFFQSRRDRVVG